MTAAGAGSWLLWSVEDRPRRFVCAPHAGAGASVFRAWADGMGGRQVGRVQLPGRETRWKEAHCAGLTEAVGGVTRELLRSGSPLILYGQSMGALLCFQVARALKAAGAECLQGLIVANRRAPQLGAGLDMATLSDDDLLSWLEKAEGVSAAMLAHAKWRKHFLPIVRADLELSEQVADASSVGALDVPLLVLRGAQDAVVPESAMRAWLSCTTASASYVEIPGARHAFTSEELLGPVSSAVTTWIGLEALDAVAEAQTPREVRDDRATSCG